MAMPNLSLGGDKAMSGSTGGTINNDGSGFPFSAPAKSQNLMIMGGLLVLAFVLFRGR